ncbi:MAG: hypothetical protein KDM63_07815 [Verrucomicrobiae bacterium]|nr:hypothetical protein [Verrucomicrobiae bacterium]
MTNGGSLSASNGTVGLATGSQILVTATGDERVFVEVGSSGKVEHTGEIRAAIAELKAAGTDPNVIAVNIGGVVEATGVQRSGGKIFLNGGGGKLQITAPIEAKPAPDANPVSGTVIEIGGGDIDIRDTHVQAFGPGDADIALNALRDVTITNATVGPVDATGGSLTATTGRDFKLSGDGGQALFGGTDYSGNPVETVIEVTAGRDVVVTSSSTGPAEIGDPRTVGRPNISAGGNINLVVPVRTPIGGGGRGGNIIIIGGGTGGGTTTGSVLSGGNGNGTGSFNSASQTTNQIRVQNGSATPGNSPFTNRQVGGAGRNRRASASGPLSFEMRQRSGHHATSDPSTPEGDAIPVSGNVEVVPVEPVKSDGPSSSRGTDASQIRRLFDPMGCRQFIETRIGGQ